MTVIKLINKILIKRIYLKACENKNVGCAQNCSIDCNDGLCNNVNDSCHCQNGQKRNHDCNGGKFKFNSFYLVC